jgi:hypothetical protein
VYFMKALSNRTGFVVLGLATAALGLGAAGCSSSNSGGGDAMNGQTNQADTCTNETALQIAFGHMYSAYVDDPSLTFQLPAIVNGVSGANVKWTASDMTAVKLEPGDASGGVLITMLKAGSVTIKANLGGQCGSAPLDITEATKADWQAGSDRYNNMNPLPMVMTDPTTGLPTAPPGGFNQNFIDPPDHPPACTNCHGDTATSSYFRTVSHTPQQTGGFSDDQLAGIITQAAVPMAGYFDNSIIPQQFWMFFHRWSDIQNPKQMVVYLRSLTPKMQSGRTDFGGFMIPARPMGGTGGATGAGGAATMGTGGADMGAGGADMGAGGASGGAAGAKADAGP